MEQASDIPEEQSVPPLPLTVDEPQSLAEKSPQVDHHFMTPVRPMLSRGQLHLEALVRQEIAKWRRRKSFKKEITM